MRLFEYELNARQILAEARVDSPGLCARLLVAHAAGLNKIQYIAHNDTELAPEKADFLQKLIARRAEGEPLAYILGHKEFHCFDFFVDSSTLTPRPETEMLVELALEVFPASKPVRFVDLGCGSGCIGLSLLSLRNYWRGILIDNSGAALAVTRRNQLALGCTNATILQADIFHLPLANSIFDLVVSNPPYIATAEKGLVMAETLAYEPHSALFSPCNGLAHIEAVIGAASFCLGVGGYVMLEHGAAQRNAVRDLMLKYGFCDLRLENDLAKLPRCIIGRKGA